MDWQKIVELGNECHKKTVANKESWLAVPNTPKITDEEREVVICEKHLTEAVSGKGELVK